MAPKKKPARKAKPTKKRPARARAKAARKLLRTAALHRSSPGTATSPGRFTTPRVREQLSIPGLPPEKPRTYTAEELQRTTVQTIRPGVLRAKRWQAAAALEHRTWAQWAAMQLDAAADAAGVAPLPQGAR